MISQWRLKVTKCDTKLLAKKCNISDITAKVLANRNIQSEEEAKKFLRASLEDLYSPFLMKDMQQGIDIILDAIDEGKKIVVYGDYDADGVTSTAILYKGLLELHANVEYYIPDREVEGYGMCSNRIKILKEQGTDIILTCDNGISAVEEVKLAKDLGMKVIITDHHELPFKDEHGKREYILPNADAIINPKRNDCEYPFKMLCGAGIAFKFIQALYTNVGIEDKEAYKFIELAGIGTICDVVDLVEENRIIAKNSLKMISNTTNLGLKSLIDVLGINNKEVKSYNIGFMIGPCINATGRLDTAALSVELLITNDEERAKELANILNNLNKTRQEMTMRNVEEIIDVVENSSFKEDKVLVIYKEDIHESIAGIVAGKIREKFNVPTIILTKGKEMPKGSGRSIEEYNLFEELLKCKDLLDKFGGHPMAAGLSIKEENINELRQRLNENCKLTDNDIIPKIKIDKRIPLNIVNDELISEIEVLEPFGKGNSSPLFAEKNVKVSQVRVLGKNQNTLKLTCIINDKEKIEAISFNKVNEFKEMIKSKIAFEKILVNCSDLKLDLIFYPIINEFNGNKTVQLRIKDFRLSQ
ncbi:single-stranded-DNA-specific exonuclease RecJ [Clostridium botulinum C]|uniref:Single-stranded-DNA-specific exonuclease RecJ n=2 Tax=Clostridium botulinum TaxID=1491 RepID=A0A9Q4THZ5_CLOBO|nr:MULTISPECIES: single-stranded-DNA-specific exonuclease RecJ [Clostridium]EGO88090.1 recombinase RecJ [Clostridium botulinum C str. Stockholm]KEI10268.1 recombinase RecJ [Clostridium sp. K25]MCD3194476.1 single-stranded-DNA-specific exonuclease RecJ [Clostridium botulinum C]MCD3199630.1 single-stranded-DNA-specific exonuclease RecJ [Clostridium botulinum C]MCD3205105.1 single-stranded-DNA-specific exonuclease RecJ [Clostridium botulinum C]